MSSLELDNSTRFALIFSGYDDYRAPEDFLQNNLKNTPRHSGDTLLHLISISNFDSLFFSLPTGDVFFKIVRRKTPHHRPFCKQSPHAGAAPLPLPIESAADFRPLRSPLRMVVQRETQNRFCAARQAKDRAPTPQMRRGRRVVSNQSAARKYLFWHANCTCNSHETASRQSPVAGVANPNIFMLFRAIFPC